MTDDKRDSAREGSEPQSPVEPGAADWDHYIHSDVWDRLVPGPDDLVGLVAYSLYQKRKREWIAHWEQTHGVAPSWKEIQIFISGQRDTAISDLKESATAKLYRFAESIAESRTSELQDKAFNRAVSKEIGVARDMLKNINIEFTTKLDDVKGELLHRTGFKHHIYTHVAGFFVIAVLFGAFLFAYQYHYNTIDVGRAILEKFTGGGSHEPVVASPPSHDAGPQVPAPPRRQ
jgi:hypothetical protein